MAKKSTKVKSTKSKVKTTEKVAKPKSTKKTAKKVSKTINTAKDYIKAHGEHCFFMVDGSTISDLHELADALDVMGHEVFYHHVNSERNDFSNWVREILKEAELADKLSVESTPERAQIVVLRHFLR